MSESTADVDARAAAAATGGDAGRARSLAEGAQQPPPAAVKGGATVSVAVVLLAVLVASVAALLVSSVPRAGDDVVGEGAVAKAMQGAGAGKEAPAAKPAEPVEHAVGGGGGGTPGFNSRLDAFRTWARLAWMKMKLRRPRSGEPRYGDDGGEGHGAGAAKRSFEMGKETVEQAAATAARATGDAVEATKEKVKGAAEL
ncbi:unnamed protein product [Urochloa humidicola]